jgi:hypothetical protein
MWAKRMLVLICAWLYIAGVAFLIAMFILGP